MDVAVVGAGISGLAVARELIGAGFSVTVLERRDRVGGRLLSHQLDNGSGRVDLGATWFWPGESRVQALADEFDLQLHPQHLSGDALYHDPVGTRRLDGNPIDVPSHRFSDGAQSLAEAVAGVLPHDTVQLDSTVRTVRGTGPFEIELTTNDGEADEPHTITADHLVLALPPALAVDSITFNPALPDRLRGLAAVTPVWMGSAVKVVAHFDRAFWRERGLSGSAISHIGPMRELHDMSGPDGRPAALFGFVPNVSPTPAPTEQDIRHQLVELFGPEAANPIQILIADWRAESGTSPPGVESLQAYQAFGHDRYQRPALDGRLHWSSTETSVVAPGHIEGALAAAERVAANIAASATLTTPAQGSP